MGRHPGLRHTRRRVSKSIAALLALAATAMDAAADDGNRAKDEAYYFQISRAVIRLEDATTGHPVGTGFFAHHRDDEKHYYLVTARHVVEPRRDLRARVPSQRLDTQETEVVELRIPASSWVYHPGDSQTVQRGEGVEEIGPIDVAVAKVPGIRDRRVRTVGYCPDPCPKGQKQQFLESDPLPPERVLVWGFPADIGFTLEEPRPMGRLGLVAMVAREPFVRIDGILRDERVLLLDAPIFSGNSGGPVFDFPTLGGTRLAGLISASNPSMSFAIAEPVSRIAETLDAALHSNPTEIPNWYSLKPTASRVESNDASLPPSE